MQPEKPRILCRPTNLEALPGELKADPAWLVWRLEFRKGKWTKPPFNARTGGDGSSTNPRTWSTLQKALSAYRGRGGYDGIGYVIRQGSGLCGVDLDHCGDARRNHIEPWALEIIGALNSYAEWSPIQGIRIFVRGLLPVGRRKHGDVEMYDGGRYLTVTGRHIAGTPLTIETRVEEIARVHEQWLGQEEDLRAVTAPGQTCLTDFEVLQKALRARNGFKFSRLYAGDMSDYRDRSSAHMALCRMLAFWCRGDEGQVRRLFEQSGLYESALAKGWHRRHAGDGRTYADLTVGNACRGGEFYQPQRTANA